MAAMLGALPLALGTGTGSELRYPLGITIVGGLILSQLVTLYTTPVVYLYLDRLRAWCARLRHGAKRDEALESFGHGNGMGGYEVPHRTPTRHMEEVRHP
jgi:hypothetical protein